MFVRNDLNYTVRSDLDINTAFIESLFIEIINPSKNVIVGVIYRPLNESLPIFFDKTCEILNLVNIEHKHLYFLGDFNLNLLDVSSCQNVNNFLDICMLNSLYPLIHIPTRVTSTSASLLDNVFTNVLNETYSGVLLTDVSDHFPVYAISEICVQSVHKTNSFRKREINEENIQCFIHRIQNASWTLNSSDANKAYDNFLYKFLTIYDECFPIKVINVNSKYNKNPWFNNNLRKMSKKKHLLYKKYLYIIYIWEITLV